MAAFSDQNVICSRVSKKSRRRKGAGKYAFDTGTPDVPIFVQHTLINIFRVFRVLEVGFNDEIAEIKLPMPPDVSIS